MCAIALSTKAVNAPTFPDPKMDQFKTIVPKRSDERSDQLEAGKGKQKARKG